MKLNRNLAIKKCINKLKNNKIILILLLLNVLIGYLNNQLPDTLLYSICLVLFIFYASCALNNKLLVFILSVLGGMNLLNFYYSRNNFYAIIESLSNN
tara:strand:+ start:425 stop:718 length:294 start_codon:yes stop_codon:yes gene_type:complete